MEEPSSLQLLAIPSRRLLQTAADGPLRGWHIALLVGFVLLVGFLALAMVKHMRGESGQNASPGSRGSVSASHILVKDRELCENLMGRLQEAAKKDNDSMLVKFKELAKMYSQCPSGGQASGSLGEFGPGQMVPAFDKVCWSAPVGEVQGPVETDFGYHVILVTQRTDPKYETKDAPKKK